MFFVTHMYDLARTLYENRRKEAVFLRAERLEDGTRTFRILPGAPLPTSYGKDVYDELFAGRTKKKAKGPHFGAADAPTKLASKEATGHSQQIHGCRNATGQDRNCVGERCNSDTVAEE